MLIHLKNLSFVALLWAWIADAQALTITPTETRYEAAGNRYFFTVTDWSSSDTSRSFCINPLHPESPDGCYLEAGILREPAAWSTIATTRIATLPPSKTMGQALQDLMKLGFSIPLRVSVLVPRSLEVPDGACLSLVAYFPAVGTTTPGFGPCVAPVAPVVQCDLTGHNRIDYGLVSLYQDTAEGAKSSTWFEIDCTGPTTVRIKARYPDSSGIPVGLGLKATLDIDGQDIGVVGNSTQGGVDFVLDGPRHWSTRRKFITSTLHTNGKTPVPGDMSGSTWIEIYIP